MIREAYEAGAREALEKLAGRGSEIGGTLLWAPTLLPTIAGSLAGAVEGGMTKKELREAEDKTWSNFLPGVGAYRWQRRIDAPQRALEDKALGRNRER